MSMGTFVKYKGQWISMERAIKLRQEENKVTQEEVTPEVVEEIIEEEVVNEEVTPEVEEEGKTQSYADIEFASNEHSLEELRKKYHQLFGNVSKRFWNNKEYLIDKINKYNN